MKDTIGKVAIVLLGAAWIKVYGEYKYYCGKCDANAFNKIVIDVQKEFIDSLMNTLHKREES